MDIHEILIEKDQPGIMKMRKKIGDEFQTVDIEKSFCQLDFENIPLNNLYPTGRPLSKEKIKDLKDMLDLVPEEYRIFYKFLDHTNAADFIDDVDGFGQYIDFEVEHHE